MTVFNHLQLENLWLAVGGSDSTADTAAAIAQAESGVDSTSIDNTIYPNRPNYHPPKAGAKPEYSVGLWQINIVENTQFTELEMLDPTLNARAALTLWRIHGDFRWWTTFKDGSYSIHLTGISPGGTFTATGTDDSGGVAPGAHKGWAQVNLALARHLPAAIYTSQHVGRRTAANLARRRK